MTARRLISTTEVLRADLPPCDMCGAVLATRQGYTPAVGWESRSRLPVLDPVVDPWLCEGCLVVAIKAATSMSERPTWSDDDVRTLLRAEGLAEGSSIATTSGAPCWPSTTARRV